MVRQSTATWFDDEINVIMTEQYQKKVNLTNRLDMHEILNKKKMLLTAAPAKKERRNQSNTHQLRTIKVKFTLENCGDEKCTAYRDDD